MATARRKAKRAPKRAPKLVRETAAETPAADPFAGPPAAGKRARAVAAPVAVAPVAAAPVPTGDNRPALELSAELWDGLPGGLAWNPERASSGRWTVTAAALAGNVASKFMAWQAMATLHKRHCDVTGQSIEEHALKFCKVGAAGDDIMRGTMTPVPGAWPYVRTDVVADDFPGGQQLGLGGSFFRLYLSTDPAENPERPRAAFVPDIIGLNLGDPGQLWPSTVPGWLTDGFYVAVATVPEEYRNRNVLVLRAALRQLGG